MSMHKEPLTDLEREGLEAHRLPIGTPSQSADCFCNGMRFVLQKMEEREPDFWMNDSGQTILPGMKRSYPNACKEYKLGLYRNSEVSND